jgi:EAL domain-containing protein (putative c-di-GMP-specific phosphodiesterase class I)
LEIAHRLGHAQELTELLQQIGLNKAKVLPDAGKLFVPLYPNEWELRSFIKGMQNVRRLAGDLAVVATIATDVFEDSALMRQIRDTFSPGSGLELAYEGFGASQDQLDQLASAPPEYLLFAPDIVRQLEDKPSATQKRLRNLVKGVKDLKVIPVATGLDTSVTATACQKLGFEYGAGTHLGVPFAPEGI